MIEFLYFSKKDQVFQRLRQESHPVLIVTPSPAKADSLRLHTGNSYNFDVITIAKFTSDLLKKNQDEKGEKYKRKSDLLLIFAVLKEQYFPKLSYDHFLYAYDIFSDLRSFSTDFEIMSAILNEFPVEIRQPVLILDQIMRVTGFKDEHSAYAFLADQVRINESFSYLNLNIVFWGFSHLNGQQIDLLKALSLRNNIFIPLPYHLKSKFKRGDWVNWVKENSSREVVLDGSELCPVAHLHRVNSREFSKYLKDFLKDDDQVLLGVPKLDPEHVHMIPKSDVSFKVPIDFFKIEFEKFFQELRREICGKFNLIELEYYLNSIKPQNIKKRKVIQLYLDAIKTVQGFTDENINVDEFFLKVLNLVVERNQPRLFLANFSSKDFNVELKDFSSLDSLNTERRTLICIDDRFDSIGSLSASKYTEKVNLLLASIGPLKRSDLDIEFKIWEIHSLMSASEVHVFMTDECLKYNLIWKRFFSEVKFNFVDEISFIERVVDDDLAFLVDKVYNGDFSASKIQSFVDCKRRFYFNYIDKKFPFIKLNHSLTPIQLGILSHKILEIYFNQKRELARLSELAYEVLQNFIQTENLIISDQRLKEYLLVCLQRAQNGIKTLNAFQASINKKVEWRLEQDFSFDFEGIIKGKIDCFGESDDYYFIFDFKSSATPTYNEFESFDNIQLWIYFLFLHTQNLIVSGKKIVLGFISLENPTDSKIMIGKNDIFQELNVAGGSLKVKNLKIDLLEEESFVRNSIFQILRNIKEEKKFPANPRSEAICHFCEINKICSKGNNLNA